MRARSTARFAGGLLALVLVLPLLPGATPPTATAATTARLAGASRIETAVAIAQRAFPDGSPEVFLARADVLADALAAGVLRTGPILLVPSCGEPPPAVTAEIARLDPERVIALGGEAAVCSSLLAAAAAGRTTERLAGRNRYETSAVIAREAFPEGAAEVYLARGDDSPDAVAGGALTDGPILLVPPDGSVPAVVRSEIDRQDPDRVIALGGAGVLPDTTLSAAAAGRDSDRLWGANRLETAVAISAYAFDGAPAVYLARADVFADAVAAGSLTDGPVLLVPTCGDLPSVVGSEILRLAPSEVIALGGTKAVCDDLLLQAGAASNAASVDLSRLTWEPTDGPTGGSPWYVAQDPYGPSTLYTGTLRGLYRSTDHGDHWSLVGPDGVTLEPMSVAFTPSDVVLCLRSHVYLMDRSDLAPRRTEDRCVGLFTTNEHLYATMDSEETQDGHAYLYRSPLSADPPAFTEVTVPEDLATVTVDGGGLIEIRDVLDMGNTVLATFVTTAGGRGDANPLEVVLATYDGQSWRRVDPGFGAGLVVRRVAVDPTDPTHVVATAGLPGLPEVHRPADWLGLNELIRASHDGGRTWASVTDVTEVRAARAVDVDVAEGRYWLTDVDFSLVVLDPTDRQSYRRLPIPDVPALAVTFNPVSLTFDIGDPDRIYALAGPGMVRSDDGGASWIPAMSGIVVPRLANLGVHPTDPDMIVATGNLSQLPQITYDGGATWRTAPGTSEFTDEVAFDPSDPDRVLIMSELTALYESTDRGRTWGEIAREFTGSRVYGMALASGASDLLYISNLGSNVAALSDAEVDGRPEYEAENLRGAPDYAYAVAVDPTDASIVFATYSPKIFEDHAAIWRYDADNRSWTEVRRVHGAAGATSVVTSPHEPGTVYAGFTGDGARLEVSRDQGETWRGLPDAATTFVTVHEVAADPSDPGIVYAAPWGGGLFVSRDAGATWTETDAPTVSIATVLVDPDDGDHLWLGDRTQAVVWETVDGGSTWTRALSLDPSRYQRVMTMARHDGELYVSVMGRADAVPGVFTGPSSGEVFRVDPTGPTSLDGIDRSVLRFSSDGTDLYAVTHIAGVHRLDGDRWTDITGDLPDIGFNDVLALPGRLIVAGGSDVDESLQPRVGDPAIVHALYESLDGGTSWQALTTSDPFDSAAKRIIAHPDGSGRLLAATGTGLYLSTNGGSSWTAANRGLGFRTIGAMDVAGDRLYVGTLGGGTYAATIGSGTSVSWAPSTGPAPEIANLRITLHPTDPDVLFTSVYPGGVFRSDDGGVTWSERNFAIPSFDVTDPVLQGYYSLTIDPTAPDTMYLAVYGRGVWKSTDGSATWYPLYADPDLRTLGATAVAIDPVRDLLYVGSDEGIFVSDDAGATWSRLNSGLATREILSLLVADNGRIYAGTAGYGVYTLPPGGSVWQHRGRTTGIGDWHVWDRRLYQYSSLQFDPTRPGRLYLGHFPGGFFVSDDGGRSWQSSVLGLGNDGIFSVTIHPDDRDRIFAGTYNGVVRSDDAGATWRATSTGMPPEQWPFTVLIDDEQPDVMYATTKNGQNKGFCERNTFCGVVMKSTDGGATWQSIMSGLPERTEFYMLEFLPDDHRVLFLSTTRGVYASANAGGSWQPINAGLPTTDHFVRDNVAQNMKITADGRWLVLSIVDYGVWKADLADLG